MIKRLVGRFHCWREGKHKRGKTLGIVHDGNRSFKVFNCPRCGRETKYPIAKAAA